MTHTLYVVATPIGNLEDMGMRALRVLREVPVIICERPSHTLRLLSHFDIHKKQLISHTEANKKQSIPRIIKILETQDAAFVVDAGTAGVSDPGPELVDAARTAGCKIQCVPGPSALTSAIALSGERLNKFLFIGFVPHKQKDFQGIIELCEEKQLPLVAYEAPHRIEKTLARLEKGHPQCRVMLVSEISKVYEKVLSGSPNELLERIKNDPKLAKGEFVIIVQD